MVLKGKVNRDQDIWFSKGSSDLLKRGTETDMPTVTVDMLEGEIETKVNKIRARV